MISLTAFCKDIRELVKIKEASKENAALLTSDEWTMNFYNKIEELLVNIKENPLLDIVCFDLAENEGISYARYIRKCYEKAFMILVADGDMSPMEYIRPDIMPSGLIVQPASYEDVKKVLYDVFESYMRKVKLKDEDKMYIIETKDGTIRMPYYNILYFESRNKKIYMRYGDKEVGFYSTMDKLSAELECSFVRIHRSFMVNREYIRHINLSKKMLTLKDNIKVPISRSFRSNIRELNNNDR